MDYKEKIIMNIFKPKSTSSPSLQPTTYQLLPTNRGFTLVEMLIIAPIVILVIGIFISAIVSMTGSVLSSRGANALAYSINDAMTRIDQDVKASGGFLANSFTPVAGQGYNDTSSDTTYFQNASVAKGNMLILNSYASDQNPLNPTRNLINLTSQPFGCSSPNVSQNQKLMTNIVYYVKNNTLWRRVLMPLNWNNYPGTVCATPWQKPTCLAGNSALFCAANDQELVDGVTAFTPTYWTGANPPVALPIASDGSGASSDVVRQNAMQTAASVNIVISATKTLSGRTVTRTGSIRSLSNQAPTILTQPTSPTVVSAGNTATFTTAASGANMTIQWEISQDNGSTWTTVSGATSSTLSLAGVTNAMDGYMYHVIYTNSYGQVTSSPPRLTVTSVAGWNSLSYQNSWSDYNTGYNTGRYLKTTSGVVTLSGLIARTGTPSVGETIAILPVGYRPSGTLIFGIATNPNVSGRVDVMSDGRIVYIYGSGTWLSIENIHFIADTGRYTPTSIDTFMNGWSNYNSSYNGVGIAPASYVVDNIGRVNLQGLVAPGTRGDPVRIFDLPSNLLPSQSMHVPEQCNNAFTGMGIDPRPGYSAIQDKSLGSACFSINTMYYPAGVGSWTALTLQNSWVLDAGFSAPQYTKAADGLVSVKGFIRNGSMTDDSIIATLPAGYRPGLRALFATYTNGAVGRIDIDSSGNIRFRSGSNAWFSMDGTTFYAEL